MNIYSKKQRWKLLLFVAAALIVAISLWYSNVLVTKIARDERAKIRLWADAIQKKANLVKYTNELFNKIKSEERQKVELWAQGTKQLANPNFNASDVSFIFEVIKNNQTVPVILADEQGHVISTRNLDSTKVNDQAYLKKEMAIMRSQHKPIEIDIYNGRKNFLYYKDSKLFSELKTVLDDLVRSFISEVAINSASVPVIFTDSTKTHVIAFGNVDSTRIKDPVFLKKTIASMAAQNPPLKIELGTRGKSYIFYKESFLLKQLRYYPYVQLGVIGLFLILAYFLFSTARRVEQNQVWVGMAKETAHQLGTPLSSLIAWLEYLKMKGVDSQTTSEIQKDVKRLETITERFSKIGSVPKLEEADLVQVIEESVNYIRSRSSQKVTFKVESEKQAGLMVPLNVPLFAWVIENLCKNAIDAMNGSGSITVAVTEQAQNVIIDVTDTGKGIPKSRFKTVFEPGYTTKQRGWGLGLSLVKRIIENYHSGKIFVKRSESDKGTTFRIVLNKKSV